ncbi:LOW QUALITY PROTEIN: reverse transcriptase [Phytophthora megakarya]|uniref:Reverse transcriptase n=1 Tax=Phytophthora megakarya TaxID=4795 RepID=A0A225VVL1_9STRA|nr:LOW QUALITY PROTEIN: reverse transcriptase [Phytophthora megakarya]
MPDLTVNEAEYRGQGRVVFCDDSNLVIRQMRGEIDCKAPAVTSEGVEPTAILAEARILTRKDLKCRQARQCRLATGRTAGLITLNRLHEIHEGNTELLIWADLFTGYMIAKAGPSRGAQAVAENYEECVFKRLAQVK